MGRLFDRQVDNQNDLTRRLITHGLPVALAMGAVWGACGGDDTTNPTGTQNPTTGGNAGMGGETDGGGGAGAQGGGGQGGGGAPPVFVLERPSKSGTIDINNDDSLVAMVNTGDDSVSIFTTADDERLSKVDVGDEPSALVFHPDGTTIYVANRASSSLTVITGADTATPAAAPFGNDIVGSEPTGVALSPTGRYLAVAEWAEGFVSVWDTATGDLVDAIAVASPRAVAFTNNGDENDDDELLVVPEFYGTPNDTVADASGSETSDSGRTGMVRTFSLPGLTEVDAISLAPRGSGMIAATGTSPAQVITSSGATAGITASPNQLWAVAVVDNKIYVPSISASPKGPPNVGANVQPIVYVADLTTGTEDTGIVGTTNLAREIFDTTFTINAGKLFMADIVDISFVGTNLAYVLSRGADTLQRVEYNSATGIEIGAPGKPEQIVLFTPGDPNPCRVPTGVVTGHGNARAYVNCSFDRDLGIVNLTDQAIVGTTESWADPPTGSPEESINDGMRFFHTARGRWSNQGYSDCASCHPDGLSDNITWQFAAGPRQSTSLDGSYSKSDFKQRIFNWTGIFDEMHDFERNTRDVSGGFGAIVTAAPGECEMNETRTTIDALGLGKPMKERNDNQAVVCNDDWDDIVEWVKTIRPPKALQTLDAADVTAGAQLFLDGKCNYCHGGSGWTVSRLFWVPDGDDAVNNTNSILTLNTTFTKPASWPVTWSYDASNHLSNQPGGIADDGTGPPEVNGIAPLRVACAMRNIGTFGLPGDVTLTNALEVKPDASRAQGRGGYNVPSLYGLALGAPYLHHGQARTLHELFSDPAWQDHLQAAEPTFTMDATELDQLVSYLLSIDLDTNEVALPPTATFVADGCPATFGTPD
jgi:DNA-binding beta-propeller fold protein YncE